MTEQPRRRAGLVVPALSTLLMFVVLVGLGVWQIQRRDWKLALLQAVAAAERNPPLPLSEHPSPFSKVVVTGRLRVDRTAGYGAEVRGALLGTQLIAPLEREGGPAVLLDLGWVADFPRTVLPQGEITVVGFIRPGDRPGWFSATDDTAHRQFYTLDPLTIGKTLGVTVAPFTLVALGDAPAPGAPDPARHLPDPPNNHLQYAITWFALAGVLLGVFAAYLRKSRA